MIGKIFKWGLVVVIVGGAASFALGKTRCNNVISTMRHNVNDSIDGMLDTRVVLENKLRAVQKEYPERIAGVKIQIREIEKLIENISKDRNVYQKVVTLCDDDLAMLEPQLEAYEAAGNTAGLVTFKAQELPYNAALSQANNIVKTRGDYENLLDTSAGDVATLEAQRNDMKAYLVDLEQEYQTFMNEAAKLQQEIRIIDRNEKLADMVQSQRDYRGYSLQDDVDSLAGLKTRIAEARIYQEELLRSKRMKPAANDYEAQVRLRAETR